MSRKFFVTTLLLLFSSAFPLWAQDFPAKPVRVVLSLIHL